MKTAIIIPARYGSTRLPGKPLAMIAGQTMLTRVVKIAKAAAAGDPDIRCFVATDDERIGAHADEIGMPWVMTSALSRSWVYWRASAVYRRHSSRALARASGGSCARRRAATLARTMAR